MIYTYYENLSAKKVKDIFFEDSVSLSVECNENERENGGPEESRVAFEEEVNEQEEGGTEPSTDTFRSHEEHMKHLAGIEIHLFGLAF